MADNDKKEILDDYVQGKNISEDDLIGHLLISEDEIKYDKNNRSHSMAYEFLIWFRDIFFIIVVFFIFTTFVSERTIVEGQSMEKSISDGDWIYINKFVYNLREPNQYDVIVFNYAADPSKHYIKRIIAVPGDEVDIIRHEGIYINGELLNDPYGIEVIKNIGNQDYPLIVPEGQYFVLGDNRNRSHDSRQVDVGTVPSEDIIGRAGLRVWPLSDFGFID